MNDKAMEWEAELAGSPHPAKGFTSELRERIKVRAAAGQTPRVWRLAARAGALITLAALLLLLWPQPLQHGEAPSESPAEHGESGELELLFRNGLADALAAHGFPQRADSFVEANGSDGEPRKLYSEITVSGVEIGGKLPVDGEPNTTKVDYRVTIGQEMDGGRTVEMVKDWHFTINDVPIVSTWKYVMEDHAFRLVEADDNDASMTLIK